MSIFEAIVLGIVQGLTEFLPVSSSGHLELTKVIFGDTSVPKESLMMTVVLHAATALSTIVIFRNDISNLLIGLFQFKNNKQFRYSLNIIISMIPAAAAGLFFEEEISQLFGGEVFFLGVMLLITGGLLFMADRATKKLKSVNSMSAFIIGIAQAIAIMPGISRSGATISTSVLLGIDRAKAARFSFLMVVPLILGKMAKDILSGDLANAQTEASVLIAGFIAAFVAGLLACQWMIKLVRNSQLKYFSYYCYLVGLIAITYALLN